MHGKIFNIASHEEFQQKTLEVFTFQYHNNPLYQQFCNLLKKKPGQVKDLQDIPFLPIEFFKSHEVRTGKKTSETVFTSSGTTGQETSKHFVADLSLYVESFRRGFQHFYGDVEEYAILALLPSYLERKGSSLVYMVDDLIKSSKNSHSGFYLNETRALKDKIELLEDQKQKSLLIGVSFALLDFVEQFQFRLDHTTVMETGGMKGRRKEMIRTELHKILKEGFGVEKIHSEYGMTELLSQAYSSGDGVFHCPPWMKILIRDPEDALNLLPSNKSGGVNVIDLANIYSCSFIATQDLAKNVGVGQTEILGRFDTSDIRGCNLLVF